MRLTTLMERITSSLKKKNRDQPSSVEISDQGNVPQELTISSNNITKNDDAKMAAIVQTLRDDWHEKMNREKIAKKLQLYIPTKLGVSENASPSESHDGLELISDYLNGQSRMLLLLGDSGSGKTTFGHWLVNTLWENQQNLIPFFLHLPSHDIREDFLELILRKYLKPKQIKLLKQSGRLLLFLDAYDEMPTELQGYNIFRVGNLSEWNLKVIISCRTEALVKYTPRELMSIFKAENPAAEQQQPPGSRFKKLYLQPFNLKAEVPFYIKKWKQLKPDDVNQEIDYLKLLLSLPGLSEMITNPFVLWIVMFSLPAILKSYSDLPELERYHFTRLDLFDKFTAAWFERQADKLVKSGRISDLRRATIVDDFKCYCEQLANCLWQNGATYIAYDKDGGEAWQRFFDEEGYFGGDESKKLSIVKQGALLKITDGNKYSFLHLSLQEYFSSEQLFRNVANKVSIAMGLEINKELLTLKPAMIRLGVDYIARYPDFEQALWDIIDDSKHEPRIAIASANAVTLLVAANKSFVGKKLRRIRIKDANCSGGNFDEADLQDADLRGVNFSRAWLTRANLSGSCVDNIQTGDLPWDDLDSEIIACFYLAPSTQEYLVVTKTGWIIYNAINNQRILSQQVIAQTKDEITASAISIDRGQILIGTYRSQLHLYNFRDASLILSWTANISAAPVLSIALSPAADWALTSSFEREICKWDMKNFHTGEIGLHHRQGQGIQSKIPIEHILEGHRRGVNTLVICQDGTWALSGSDDRIINRWSLPENCITQSWEGHMGAINVIILNADESYAYSGSQDRSIRRWDTTTHPNMPRSKSCIQTYNGHTAEVRALAITQDGNWLFSGSKDNTVRRWEVSTGHCLSIWYEHREVITSIVLAVNDSLVITGSYDKKLTRWETTASQCWVIGQGHTANVTALLLSPDSNTALSTGKDNAIKLWHIDHGQCIMTCNHIPFASKSIVNWSEQWVLCGCENGDILQYDMSKGTNIKYFKGQTERITALAELPQFFGFASGSQDKTIKLWNVSTNECLKTWYGHDGAITSLIVIDKEKFIISGSSDGTIRYNSYRGIDHDSTGILSRFIAPVTTLTLSQDKSWLLIGLENGDIYRYIIQTKQCKPVWRGHTASINALTVSPETRWAMSGDDNNKIILWDVGKGTIRATCSLPCPVTTMQWSQDNQSRIVIGMADGSVSVWQFKEQSLSLHLIWRSNPWGLVAKNAHLLGAYGLDAFQENILSQRGMAIQVSSRSSETILSQRQEAIEFNLEKTRRSLFDPTTILREGRSVVSIVRARQGKGALHAFLVLESIEDGFYRVRRFDFYLEMRRSKLAEATREPKASDFFGQGLIEITDCSLSDMEELVKKCFSRSCKITSDQGNLLLNNIRQDQRDRIAYCLAGAGAIYTLFRMPSAYKHHNCISWCEEHMQRIQVELIDKKWHDGLAHFSDFKMQTGIVFDDDNEPDDHEDPYSGWCTVSTSNASGSSSK